VGGRIGVVIGLDLDDPPADAVDQQRRPDQLGSDLVHAAGEETPIKSGRGHLLRCGSQVWRDSNIGVTFKSYPTISRITPRFGHTLT
jgi:hypothetical protein